MNLLTWLGLGIALGAIVNVIDRKRGRPAIIENFIMAVVGSVMGGFFTSLLFEEPSLSQFLLTLGVSILGAIFFQIKKKKLSATS